MASAACRPMAPMRWPYADRINAGELCPGFDLERNAAGRAGTGRGVDGSGPAECEGDEHGGPVLVAVRSGVDPAHGPLVDR